MIGIYSPFPGLCFSGGPGTHFSHDALLVVLSYAVAAVGSFASLDIAERLRLQRHRRWQWQAGAGATLGGSIWSMHFTGMLAASYVTPLRFTAVSVFGSLLIAIATATLAFACLPQHNPPKRRIAASGLILGAGVVAMHYTGMAGVRSPGELFYRPLPWLVSVAVGLTASVAAVAIASAKTSRGQQAAAALVMAAAICGMHYIGMAATTIPFNTPAAAAPGLDARSLAAAVAAISGALIILALGSSGADRRVAAATERELLALQRENVQLARTQTEIVQRLCTASEWRDSDTKGHVIRIGKLAYRLAVVAGCDTAFTQDLLAVAPLHDIGKIAMPDSILCKPGALTPAERIFMLTHTEIGESILAGSNLPLLDLAARIAVSHHERWDGSGYPHGLSGEAIPLEGRIVAIVDVFDALLSRRSYKAAWTLHDVGQYIRNEAGKQFDPRLVEAFLADLPVMAEIQRALDGGGGTMKADTA